MTAPEEPALLRNLLADDRAGTDGGEGRGEIDLLDVGSGGGEGAGAQSAVTVAVAFGVNLLVALAKSAAAVITGSASMVAEAAHSWADAGNEIFLVIAQVRSKRAADQRHPLGHGREAYVWSMFAALGLFAAGAAVSVTHGIQELLSPEPGGDFVVAYVVLAVSAVLEGVSFAQSVRQARPAAASLRRGVVHHVLQTTDPTLRAVFAEDAAALVGLGFAACGIALHQLTGSPVWDAVGSIFVGLLLGVVAIVLINRNRRFLVGEDADPQVRRAVLHVLLAHPDVARVTYLRLEVVGPLMVTVVAKVDLTGDQPESALARRLLAIEDGLTEIPGIVGAILGLAPPDGRPGLSA